MTIIDTLLAALPLALIVVLMISSHWSGAKAGAAGWLAALIIAVLRFTANAQFLFWTQIDALFRAAQVLYIIWGALFLFRITEANGALNAMSTMLRQISPEKTLQVLIMGWAVSSFLQSVGGFGVPMGVVAPCRSFDFNHSSPWFYRRSATRGRSPSAHLALRSRR